MDDFLFAGKPGDSSCKHKLHIFHIVCAQFGVPIANDKTAEPTQHLTFLRAELDTVSMQMLLPRDILIALRTRIQDSLLAEKNTLQTCSLL